MEKGTIFRSVKEWKKEHHPIESFKKKYLPDETLDLLRQDLCSKLGIDKKAQSYLFKNPKNEMIGYIEVTKIKPEISGKMRVENIMKKFYAQEGREYKINQEKFSNEISLSFIFGEYKLKQKQIKRGYGVSVYDLKDKYAIFVAKNPFAKTTLT